LLDRKWDKLYLSAFDELLDFRNPVRAHTAIARIN